MEQKRAMLYPEFDGNNLRQIEQRNTASAAIGLPIEAPPSYDSAILAGSRETIGWAQNVQNFGVRIEAALPVNVEQQLSQEEQPSALIADTTPAATYNPSKLGPDPCSALCPACGTQETTRMTFTANYRTHLGAFLLCIVGWCCCACFVPYCMNSCRTGNHYCSKCNTFLGTYNPRHTK